MSPKSAYNLPNKYKPPVTKSPNPIKTAQSDHTQCHYCLLDIGDTEILIEIFLFASNESLYVFRQQISLIQNVGGKLFLSS